MGDKEQISTWRILVVDDEPDSLEVVTRVLSFYGATVYTAANGVEALSIVDKVLPTFILMDLSMPKMDGWETLYHLQKDRRTADIPVIALTAHAMQGDRERVLHAGFHSYLTKPLSPATFAGDLLKLFSESPLQTVGSGDGTHSEVRKSTRGNPTPESELKHG